MRSRPLALLLSLTALAFSLSSCGGSGGDSTNDGGTTTPTTPTITGATFQIIWPSRSRSAIQSGLSSARSATIVFPQASATGTDVTQTVNRDPANLEQYTATYTISVPIRKTAGFFVVDFRADAAGAGQLVGRAAGTLSLSANNLEVGTIILDGVVQRVVITDPGSVALGDAPRQLEASVLGKDDEIVAVSPGSLIWRIATGGSTASITADGILTILAAGTATISVTVDGIVAPPRTITVNGPTTGPQTQVLPLVTNDLAFDRVGGRLWATIPASAVSNPSRLIGIDPATGSVVASINVGAEPDKVAITDDGQFAYVSVTSDGTIRRVDLTSGTPVATIAVGQGSASFDLATLPGLPNSFAVASDPNGGLNTAIYDGAVRRSGTGAGGRNLQFASATTLYGEGNGGQSLFTDMLTPTSIAFTRQTEVDTRSLQYSDGLLYTANARIVDPSSQAIIDQLPTSDLLVDRIAAVSSSDDRLYILTWDSGNPKRIVTFDRTARTSLGPYNTGVVEGGAENLTACGNHTLAFNLFGVSTRSIVIVRGLP